MKIPARDRGRGLTFNITPLIDIVFLLIIFFLAATHFARSETAEAIELPTATQGIEEERPDAPRVTVTITADQMLHVQGREMSMSDFDNLILATLHDAEAGIEVRIRTDRSVPYRVIEPILLTCARNGISDVEFAVIPK